MKNPVAILSLLAVTLTAPGCWMNSLDCSNVEDLKDELRSELEIVHGTTRVFEATNDRGAVRIEMTFGATPSSETAARRPAMGLWFARSVSNVLIPDAHASECSPPDVFEPATYTVEWTPTGEETRTLYAGERVNGRYEETGPYMADGSSRARAFRVDDEGVAIELHTPDGRSDSFELIHFEGSVESDATITPSEWADVTR